MSLKVDKENDALYFRLDEAAIVESEEVQPGIILDFNSKRVKSSVSRYWH